MKSPRARFGFMLTQLLAVIAIIGTLAAILSPVFARTHENAMRTACVGNSKRIGTAIAPYTGDRGDPPPRAAGLRQTGADQQTAPAISMAPPSGQAEPVLP